MDAARWELVQALFHQVADLPGPAQRAALEARCHGDPVLMMEVRDLLDEDARGDSLLDRDAAHVAAQVLDEGIPLALLDQNFGPYRLREVLGAGGMGVVYLAEREDLGSIAAIKILRDAWLSPDRRDRFASEQRTLAQLNHPAIARLYDADTLPDGTPWFVMEYVEGAPLTTFCEEHASSIPERLRLFRAVCEAVEHAHGHLIIHRDLKPSNILVKPDGSVKLLDFGIAKQLYSLDGPVDQTATGLRLMTPAYAAPEQLLGDPVGIHTDIYTLGVVLYELLTGRLPFDLTNRTPAEAETIIVEQGPARPSATARETVAGGSPVPPVSKQAWADLDVLCLTAMQKEPERRYRTVEALIRDVDHYLTGEPLEARPDTLGYRLGKYLRRNWRPVSARVLFAALTVGFLLGLGVLFAWRRTPPGGGGAGPKRVAVLPFENVGDSADAYFTDGLTDAVRGKLTALRGLEVIGSASSAHYRNSSETPQQIGRELDVRYLLIGKVRWAKRAGAPSRVQVSPELIEVPSGIDKWQQPFDAVLRDVFEVQGDIATRVAQSLNVALGIGVREQLAERPTQNLAAYDAFLRGEAASQGYGRYDPASLRRALPYYEQAVALDSTFVEAWAKLSWTHANLYSATAPTDAEFARRAAERTLALAPNRPEGHFALAEYYGQDIGDWPRAYVEASRALELGPGSAPALTQMGYAEMVLGRWEAARAHFEEALRLDPLQVRAMRLLTATLGYTRHVAEARQVCDRGLALAPTNLTLLAYKAGLALEQGDLAGARAGLAAAPKQVDTALVATMAGYNFLWALDDAQQALLLRLRPRAFDGNRAAWAIAFARTYGLRGDVARARVYADSARVALEEQLRVDPGSALTAGWHASLGLALAYLGRKAEAMREGERSVTITPITKDAFYGPTYQLQLARIYLLVDEPEKALDQLEPLLKMPSYLSPEWLKIDPNFAPLRGNPRFERLLASKGD